ncbi:MAG: type II toxin-antitoxin system VapC family toxin [Thermoleophilia bacterium]|nr:type II toxin-antitoxin system VapC family toxin [Thermoleophilia bacterium]
MTRLLLDTNVVVWLLLGDRGAVSDRATRLLLDEANSISVSAVSFWEIAIKRSLGKLEIDANWAKTLTQLDFNQMPITAEHAALVEHLPWHHRDPFDRLLIAQARLEDHSLVSADRQMKQYDVEVVW